MVPSDVHSNGSALPQSLTDIIFAIYNIYRDPVCQETLDFVPRHLQLNLLPNKKLLFYFFMTLRPF